MESTVKYETAIFNEYDGWSAVARTNTLLDAWNIYRVACGLAEFIGTDCALIDDTTGEVIENLVDEEDY